MLAAASIAPVNNFDGNINATLNLRFVHTMTGTPRIPCGPSGLPDEGERQATGGSQDAKKALRKRLRETRNAVGAATRVQWDAHIGAQVVGWWRRRQMAVLGVYWPMHGEPDLRAAYAELSDAGAQLALPVVAGRAQPLAFAAWTPGEPLVADEMGVMVPARLRFVDLPGGLLVPCLGFNEEGYRLGYGGGFYDRTLEALPRPLTLGIAYSCQEAVFAHAAHDVPLDVIVTELTEVR
jgi:5,10-methenyltetrahydrofolate synthetase